MPVCKRCTTKSGLPALAKRSSPFGFCLTTKHISPCVIYCFQGVPQRVTPWFSGLNFLQFSFFTILQAPDHL